MIRRKALLAAVELLNVGEARVQCLKVPNRAFLVARVPFAKNGGGDQLNQFTVTMMVKLLQELPEHVYSTAGWDSWSKLHEGDDPSQLRILQKGDGEGVLGKLRPLGRLGHHGLKLERALSLLTSNRSHIGGM